MTAIRVELQLADGSFTTGLLRAGQSLKQFQDQLVKTHPQLASLAAGSNPVIAAMHRMETSTKGFLGTLRDVTLATGLVSMGLSKLTGAANGWIGDIIRINAEMERLTYQMRAMSTAADPMKDAANSVKYLREQASKMPFSLKEISNSFVKLKATGTDPMNGSLQSIADGIAAFGGNDESLHRTILGITQAAGKGVLQMEELRQQIGESMPVAMQLLARSMGMTVGQLAKEIQTGTVASRPALDMLYRELDRSFGGTAQRMMQTFSGQITQLHTNLQNLATNEGGKGFFDQVKTQLRDINTFLSSDMANQIAVSLGQGLNSAIVGLRNIITTVWSFRDELMRLATVAASGVGLLALTRGVTGLTAAMRASILTTGIYETNMTAAWASVRNGVASFRNLGTVVSGTTSVVAGLGGMLSATVAGLAGLAPLIIGAGVAAYMAAEYFGLLTNKTKDAYDELVKFGAESRRQAEDIGKARLAQLDAQIEAEKKRMLDKGEGLMLNAQGKLVPDESIGALWTLIEERKKITAQIPKLIEDAGRREDDRVKEDYQNKLNDMTEVYQRAYNEKQNKDDQAFERELAKAEEVGASKAEIETKYKKTTIENQRTLSKSIIDTYDKELKTLQAMSGRADADGKRAIQIKMDMLRGYLIQQRKELSALNIANMAAPKTVAGADDSKNVERAADTLARLKQDIAGLTANLNGASGAAAEMREKIATGDYGSVREGGAAVQELHDNLIAAAEAKEKLDKVMKGNQEADRDLERIKQDLREKELALVERQMGRKLNDAEKMKLRLDNNGYFGLGPYENIKKALGDIISSMNIQGEAANQVAIVMRENTFSNATVKHVDSVTEAVARLTGQVGMLSGGLNGLNFSSIGQGLPGPGSMFGGGTAITQFSGSMLELIAKGESGGNYNATLDNGLWTGGPQNLVGMTLNQIRDLQRTMLANPANRARYGNGLGSSALGKYQIVGKTLEGLMSEMGLSGNELFDEKMQDQMAMRLLNRRLASGEGLDGLRKEWTSLKNVPDAVINGAMNGMSKGPTREAAAGLAFTAPPAAQQLPTFAPITVLDHQVEKTADLNAEIEKANKQYQDLAKRESDADLSDWMKQTAAETKDLGKDAEDTGKRYDALVKAITSGKFGKSDTDRNPESARYKDAIAAAKEYDRVAADVNTRKKLRSKTDQEAEKLEQDRVELNRRLAEAQKKAADPNYLPDSNELQRLTTDLDAYVKKVLELNNGDRNAPAYKQALETRANMLRGQRQLEANESRVAFNKETQDLRNSLMTQTQIRQQEMYKALAAVDAWVEQQRKAGMNEVEITRAAEEQKALIRQKYAQESSPMQKQMKEWGDIQGNLAQASTRWMDSLAGGISDLIMGTGDLRSVIQGILKDIVNMGVKYMMSGMFQGKGGTQSPGGKKGAAAAATAGGKKGAPAAAASGKKAIFPIAHTGGIVGSSSLLPKMASSAIFANAPKFHTGGIIDGLLPSEVPIIAKKGEGVFTPEQMAAMGSLQGAQQINITSPITVNGSSGTPEQNNDLAKKMAREMEQSMRGMIADEMRKQTRPGNFMNTRSR